MSNHSISPTQPKLKQLRMEYFCSPLQQHNSRMFSMSPVLNSTPKENYTKRRKAAKSVLVKRNLDGWLSKKQLEKKENCEPPINTATTNILTKYTTESFNSTSNPSSNNADNQTVNSQLNISNNDDELCLKYKNIRLPSVKDIVEYEESLKKEKEYLEYFDSLQCSQKSIEPLDFNTEDDAVLDCKHFALAELTTRYQSNLKYISDIFHGKRFCERHERFRTMGKMNKRFREHVLSYNVSMISFTVEQKEHLLDMLHEDFVEETMGENSQYFCRVLLPELCLKIFMDTHHMNNEEALEYLVNH